MGDVHTPNPMPEPPSQPSSPVPTAIPDPVQSVAQILFPGRPLTPTAFRELMTPPPRSLRHVEAELLFIDGQIIVHRIDANSGGHTFKCISPGSAAIAFNQQVLDSGWLDGIVRHGKQLEDDWAVLFTPPTRRAIAISCSGSFQPTDQATVLVEVPFPATVMMVKGHDVWLWCVNGDTFNPKAKVYLPPLPNVDGNGHLCFGANTKPEGSVETIHQIHAIWWDAVFTSHQVEEKSRRYPNDVRLMLWDVQALKKYPLNDLRGTKKSSIADVVERVIHR